MAPLGTRKGDVRDALSTDLGGLTNLLEWCPFITPPVNRGVVINVRENMGETSGRMLRTTRSPTLKKQMQKFISEIF